MDPILAERQVGKLAETMGFASSRRVLGHDLEGNRDLPLLELEGGFRKQAQYRQMLDDGDGCGGEQKFQKEIDWKF